MYTRREIVARMRLKAGVQSGRIVSNKMRASLYRVRAKRKPKPVSKAIPVKIEAQTP
jgi:hypothetical protein